MLPPTHPRGRGEKGRTEGTEKQQHGDSCAGRGGGTEAASETEELTSGPQSSEKTDGGAWHRRRPSTRCPHAHLPRDRETDDTRPR